MTHRRRLRPLAALATVALIGAGCTSGSAEDGGTTTDAAPTQRGEAVRFAECMRDHGVRAFPDPGASGELTVDGVVNGSSLDPGGPVWEEAIDACRDLQPPGFTGQERSPEQQRSALAFARCMRENGIEDFPDPAEGGPLIDTTRIPSAEGRGALDIPGFQAAQERCTDSAAGALGRGR